MAEYYAVLSRAVASLEGNTADGRRAVYDKARNALIGQLKAIVPPLPTSEISRQRLELEEAIRRVERESATAGGMAPRNAGRPTPPPQRAAPPPERAAPPPPPPQPAYEEAQEAPAPASPQEVFRRAIRQAESRAANPAAPPPLERAAPARGPDYGSMDFHVGERARVVADEGPAPYVTPGADYRDERAPVGRAREPRLAPDYDWEPEPTPQPEPPGRFVPEPFDDGPADRGGRRRGRGREAVDSDFEDVSARPSRLPTIILLVLIVAMIGGLGALAWSQRGVISEILASLDGSSGGEAGSAPPPAPPPPAPAAAADTSGKDSARLLDGGGIPATPGVRVVGGEDNGADATAPAPADAAPTGAAPASTTADAGVPVAQKAVLYEEPTDSEKAANGVFQFNAAVTWSYAADGPDGPAIIANLDVPERGLKVKLTFRKNNDNTLPASHLIEVVTQASSTFPGKGIGNVPRVMMKPAEDARGQPLIGASAKVADGFFWIALSALDADVQANLAMLRDRNWIDLQLVYDTGQRAILTFEKGTAGDRVFSEALAAWTG